MKCARLVPLLVLAAATAAQTFQGRRVDEWVGDLASADESARDAAARALVAIGARNLRPLREALADPNAAVRAQAAAILGRLGRAAEPARAALVKLCDDANAEVSHAARVALLRVRVDEAQVPALLEALRGDDRERMLAAAEVAEQLGKKAAPLAGELVSLLQRTDAAVALPFAVPGGWKRSVRQAAARAVGAIGPVDGVASAVALVPLVDDRDVACRRAALASLLRLVDPRSAMLAELAPVLTRRLRDDDSDVRRLAAELLGGCGPAAADAVPVFADLLGSVVDRPFAIAALGRLGPIARPAKHALAALLDGEPGPQQQAVLAALARIAPDMRDELRALEEFLRERAAAPAAVVAQQDQVLAALADLADADREKSLRAVQKLADLHAVAAIPHLVPWLAEGAGRDDDEIAAAVRALCALDAEQIVPRLRMYLASPCRELREAAAAGLAMFDDVESRPAVVKVLLEGVVHASGDDLWALGLTGVAELAPVLEGIAAAPTENWARQWGAVQGLACLRRPSSAPVVLALATRTAENASLRAAARSLVLAACLRALATLDAAAGRLLFAKFADADEREVRLAAQLGQAQLGDEKARSQLLKERPAIAFAFELPAEVRQRLETERVRLSQVKGCRLREVLPRLSRRIGMPIVLAAGTDAKVLDGVFGDLAAFLGSRPSVLQVLTALEPVAFEGTALCASLRDGRIVLAPIADDGAPTKR